VEVNTSDKLISMIFKRLLSFIPVTDGPVTITTTVALRSTVEVTTGGVTTTLGVVVLVPYTKLIVVCLVFGERSGDLLRTGCTHRSAAGGLSSFGGQERLH